MIRLAVVLLAVALAGCCADSPPESRVFTISPADHAEEVDDCFGNDLLCKTLCSDLLGPPPSDTVRDVTECYVDRRADGNLDVHATSHLIDDCFGTANLGTFDPPPPDAGSFLDGGPLPDAAIETDASPAADAASGP